MRAAAFRIVLAVGLVASIAPFATQASAADSSARSWYVKAGAPTGGTGSAAHPFATLVALQHASRAGDTIVVLPSTTALDGGIALRPRQRLIGAGAQVRSLPAAAVAPSLTNTTTNLAGDAVRLADDTTVQNLRIRGARRGAVYGLDVTGVRVRGLDVSGQNHSCKNGFLIPQFNAPTNVPGVGAPIPGGLRNGWAAIMVDAADRQGGTVQFDHNTVHDATCGDGLDVRVYGSASYRATIEDNDIRQLGQGPLFLSLLAIGLQTRDHGTLTATVAGNTETDLGNRLDLNLVQGADSEGVFANAVDASRLAVAVDHNTYTNPHHLGGFSANGLEAVTMHAGARMSIAVRDSSFTGSTGDVIEEGALGTDAVIDMSLDHVVAAKSAGIGNTGVLPFNNGDCLLAGSLGARNTIRLAVRESVLSDCSDNGLSIGSNVVTGHGPTTRIAVTVDRSTLTGNRGGNLGIRNFTALDDISVAVAHTDLRGSHGLGSAVAALAAEDLGRTRASGIDLGGGALGSPGGNCIQGRPLSADVLRYHVSARGDWWGRVGGPRPLQTLVLGGSLDHSAALSAAPPCGAQ